MSSGNLETVEGFWVYGLLDPRTGALRYVGKTTWGMTRVRAHWSTAELARRNYKANWLRQLRGKGLRPDVVVLETAETEADLLDAEVRLISWFRSLKHPLTNMCDGGISNCGPRHDAASRAKIAASHRGKRASAETRMAMSSAQKARPRKAIVDSLGRTYRTLTAAGLALHIPIGNISQVLHKKRNSAGGLSFNWVDNVG